MTRPPKSPPSVETGPPSSRAPPKRHPERRPAGPSHRRALSGRETKRERARQAVSGSQLLAAPAKRRVSRPALHRTPFRPPLHTAQTPHSRTLSHSLHPTAARLSTTTRQERRSSGTQNHSFKVYRPSVRCGPSREAGPPFTFKISMLHVFCGSHGFTHFAALFIDPRAE